MPATAPRTRPLAAVALVLAVLGSPSVLIAGAVQIAVAVDAPASAPGFTAWR